MHDGNRKPKLEADKRRSMKEAVADAVRDGDTLLIDGFTHLICFAAGHEIIRQGRRGLTGVRLTPDLVYDQMIEAGCFSKLIFSWAGNPGVGSLHALRRAVEKDGTLELDEYTHFGMVARLLAASSSLPFWPLRNFKGSNVMDSNPNIKWIECPYTGEELATVPALHPDVAVVHCQRADPEGNAQVWGLFGTQKEVAFAAQRLIVVTEEIVDRKTIRRDPNRTLIPGILVDHVVHEPWGCHPSFVQGYYDRDNDFYVKWDEISRDTATYQNYLEEFVHGVADRKQYLKKLESGLVDRLKATPRVCEGVDYGF